METDRKTEYSLFCQQTEDLPIFFQDWYLDAVCVDGAWNAALVKKQEKIVAVLPYFLKRKAGFRYISMPKFVKFMGPYLLQDYRAPRSAYPIMEALIGQLPRVHAYKQDFHYTAVNWLPFYWAGFRQQGRFSYRLELKDLDTVYGGINRNMRRNIKRAQQLLTVESSEDLATFYQINRLSFDRQGISIPYSFELLQRHDKALQEHNARQIFFARDEQGRIHSAAYLIWDQHACYYHLSGDDPQLRQSGGGILLIWEAIQYAHSVLKVPVFDFEGSMLPAVEKIRRQFGALPQPYSRIEKYYSRTYQLLDYLLMWWRG